MIIEQLVSQPSNAASLLAKNRRPDGFADISDDRWDRSLAIIKGVVFDRIQLVDRVILPNFVDCSFEASRFITVKTDAHFWAARNLWRKCLFSKVHLKRVISPQNRFVDCLFDNVFVTDYKACETIFTSCTFKSSEFHSLMTVTNMQGKEHMEPLLQFVNCVFEDAKFFHCAFKDVSFRNCNFIDPIIEKCDFTGVDADKPWWPKANEVDLFVAFLDQVIETLVRRLGIKSMAVEVLQNYHSAYVGGRTTNKDYSAVLYGGRIPDKELDVVEKVLDELGPRFRF